MAVIFSESVRGEAVVRSPEDAGFRFSGELDPLSELNVLQSQSAQSQQALGVHNSNHLRVGESISVSYEFPLLPRGARADSVFTPDSAVIIADDSTLVTATGTMSTTIKFPDGGPSSHFTEEGKFLFALHSANQVSQAA